MERVAAILASCDWCLSRLQGPKKRIACHGTEIGFYLHQSKGVDWVFVDHPSYPRPGGIYADQYGVYGDNQVCMHQCSSDIHSTEIVSSQVLC